MDNECAPSEGDRSPQIDEVFNSIVIEDEKNSKIIEILEKELLIKNLKTILQRLESKLNEKEVKTLLNHLDDFGYAIIHYFAYLNFFEVFELLKEYGVDMNLESKFEKHSPLVIAALQGHEMTVQALIRNGASFLTQQKNILTNSFNALNLEPKQEE